jgi:hypothetical protein
MPLQFCVNLSITLQHHYPDTFKKEKAAALEAATETVTEAATEARRRRGKGAAKARRRRGEGAASLIFECVC